MITRPGQREWEGILLDIVPGDSGVWIGSDTDVSEGWWVTFSADDLETEDGVSRGREIPQAMYPSILALRCDTAEALVAFMEACTVGTTGDLSWCSEATEHIYTAEATVRRCQPREAKATPYYLLDVVWVIDRPLEIVDLSEGS